MRERKGEKGWEGEIRGNNGRYGGMRGD